jgi:putative endonuclease
MTFIYILKSIFHKKSYVGLTNNLDRRIDEHNLGRNIYSSKFRPWQLIYAEKLSKFKDAKIKEKYFKSASGRRKMKKLFQ